MVLMRELVSSMCDMAVHVTSQLRLGLGVGLGLGLGLGFGVAEPHDVVEGELVVEPLALLLVEQAPPPRHRHRLGGGRVAEEDHARVERRVAGRVARGEGAPVGPLVRVRLGLG